MIATAAIRNSEIDLTDLQLLKESNVNSETFLATDYLNHFNEVSMLIEMLGSMPDCIEDVLAWEPVSYQEHFSISGLRGADVAIAAYENATPDVRQSFDTSVDKINQRIEVAKTHLQEILATQDSGYISAKTHELSHEINLLIDEASGIVNGTGVAEIPTFEDIEAENSAQFAIDALFD